MIHQQEQDTVYILEGWILDDGWHLEFEERLGHLGFDSDDTPPFECHIPCWKVGTC